MWGWVPKEQRLIARGTYNQFYMARGFFYTYEGFYSPIEGIVISVSYDKAGLFIKLAGV
jgi:hypothetical protein